MEKTLISLEDRFKGCLLGAAIGDALGMPTEYLRKEYLDKFYNGKIADFENPLSDSPCRHLKAGQYTDDTQQTMILANSLIKNHGFDMKDFAKDIGEWGWKCKSEKGYNRFGGGTSISAALEIYAGKDPIETGVNSPSCGAAMRIAPIGLFYNKNNKRLKDYSIDASRITHKNLIAIDSAVMVSLIIASLINKKDPISSAAFANKNGIEYNLKKNVEHVIENSKTNPDEVAKFIGASENAIETVPMAIHCFLHSPEDYEKTVINAANLVPGDTDSIACIAGAISGAYNGIEGIPKKFLERVESKDELEKIARNLYLEAL